VFYLLVGALSIGQWRVSNSGSDETPPSSGFWANLSLYFSWASSTGWLNAIAGGTGIGNALFCPAYILHNQDPIIYIND
jgi:hypothetical protein